MDGSVPIDAVNARNHAAKTGQEFFLETASGNILPPDGWFMRAAQSLWGQGENSPAKWLRSLTGFPERTCRSAVSGDTDVSSAMLYALLRGEQGERVLGKLMEGSKIAWWIDLQRAAHVGRQVLNITK